MHFVNDVDHYESEDDITVEIKVYKFVLLEPSFWSIEVHN
jgi:hypothetical protein